MLKYGSWAGFFAEHDLDLACLQARSLAWDALSDGASAPLLGSSRRMRRRAAQLNLLAPRCNRHLPPRHHKQESKVIDERISKELACVEGYQSFWACSRCASASAGRARRRRRARRASL